MAASPVLAIANDDSFPGAYVDWVEPVEGDVDATADAIDMYAVYFEVGECVELSLDGPGLGENLDLALYSPDGSLMASASEAGSHESLAWTVQSEGYWTVAVVSSEGAGSYMLEGYFQSPDDNIEEAPIAPTEAFTTTLDSYSDTDDVYRVWLDEGDRLFAQASPDMLNTSYPQPDIYLFGPGSTDIGSDLPLAESVQARLTHRLTWTAEEAGWYYVDLFEYQGLGSPRCAGKDGVIIAVRHPVYQFYNPDDASVYYSDDLHACLDLAAADPTHYVYDGTPFFYDPAADLYPVYRFWNHYVGRYFYVIEGDRAEEMSRTGFRCDGVAFYASQFPDPGKRPVWGVWDQGAGPMLFTTSWTERQEVCTLFPDFKMETSPRFYICGLPWLSKTSGTMSGVVTDTTIFTTSDDEVIEGLPLANVCVRVTTAFGTFYDYTDYEGRYRVSYDGDGATPCDVTFSTWPHSYSQGWSCVPEYFEDAHSLADATLLEWPPEGVWGTEVDAQLEPRDLLAIYRFYNLRNGTHFYTPSATERDSVISRLGNTYTYEGIAYWTDPCSNAQPLYRFFNKRSGSHFYTASPAERDYVQSNLAATYSYDGPTFSVSTSWVSNSTTVWRFYNRKNGSHFYTASEQERDSVLARLGDTYTCEGAAFQIGQ